MPSGESLKDLEHIQTDSKRQVDCEDSANDETQKVLIDSNGPRRVRRDSDLWTEMIQNYSPIHTHEKTLDQLLDIVAPQAKMNPSPIISRSPDGFENLV